MKNNQKNKILFNLNLKYTLILVITNIIVFCISGINKNYSITLSIFVNCFLFFLYRFKVAELLKTNLLSIKKELFYINYPFVILSILILILLILISNIGIIAIVNMDALNPAFVFSFFVNTITMLTPALLLIVYIYLITPAFVIPAIEKNKNNKKTNIILIILFLIFLLLSFIKVIYDTVDIISMSKKERFKATKLPVIYSDKYIKYKDLTQTRVNILSKDKVNVPLYYTSEGFRFNNYYEAEQFCKSINARVPNHREIYNIVFNNFDTFGEQYYWTSNFAGKYNLLLHFKNMSYEILLRKDYNIKPILYCISNEKVNYKLFDKKYFNKLKNENNESGITANDTRNFKFPPDINEIKASINNQKQIPIQRTNNLPMEAKMVNFSIRHVSNDILTQLINEGYNYNPKVRANSYYEKSEYEVAQKINTSRNNKQINLCYYPFIDYTNISIKNQIEIWKQSFCSPSFEILSPVPVLKTGYEKDSYCYAHGGRVPNIPELTAILKVLDRYNTNEKYWTNTGISNYFSDNKTPLAIKYQDSTFMQPIIQDKNASAYTYCVKDSANASRVIANYQSKFYNENGSYYAKQICPACAYYEMPDTVIMQ